MDVSNIIYPNLIKIILTFLNHLGYIAAANRSELCLTQIQQKMNMYTKVEGTENDARMNSKHVPFEAPTIAD